MTTTLGEVLREWLSAEEQCAVFHAMLGLQVLELTTDDVDTELLSAIRRPLLDLYSLSLDETDRWEEEPDV